MNIQFDYENAFFSIEEEIARIPEVLKSERKIFIKKAAKIIKKNVIANLPKSDLDASATNYDGSPYVHMKDDVKTSVKDDNEGTVFAIVKGGKYTGYKWHLVNNGHLDRKGNFVQATHFIDNAFKQSENEIDSMVDEMIRKAVQ